MQKRRQEVNTPLKFFSAPWFCINEICYGFWTPFYFFHLGNCCRAGQDPGHKSADGKLYLSYPIPTNTLLGELYQTFLHCKLISPFRKAVWLYESDAIKSVYALWPSYLPSGILREKPEILENFLHKGLN